MRAGTGLYDLPMTCSLVRHFRERLMHLTVYITAEGHTGTCPDSSRVYEHGAIPCNCLVLYCMLRVCQHVLAHERLCSCVQMDMLVFGVAFSCVIVCSSLC